MGVNKERLTLGSDFNLSPPELRRWARPSQVARVAKCYKPHFYALEYQETPRLSIRYQRVVVALNETIRIMGEIDAVIEARGGWPIQ